MNHSLEVCYDLRYVSLITVQFSRTVAPDTSKGPALIAFMQQNKWRKIAIVSSTESLWFEIRLGLAKQLEDASITVLRPTAFEPGSFTDAALGEIRRSGIRIVFVLSYTADAQSAASLAQQEGMTMGYAWLVVSEQVAVPDMAGWLWFRPFLRSNMEVFAKQVSDYSKSNFNITVRPDSVDLAYSAALYDAIMLYAYSVSKVMSEGGDVRDGEAVTAAVRNTTIEGVGGTTVALDSNGDRIESFEVMNYVLEAGDAMSSVAVGLYNSSQGQYKAYKRAVVWPGENSTEVPADYLSGTLAEWTCSYIHTHAYTNVLSAPYFSLSPFLSFSLSLSLPLSLPPCILLALHTVPPHCILVMLNSVLIPLRTVTTEEYVRFALLIPMTGVP